MDATERWNTEAMVWQGSVGKQALHTYNLLVLRGPKAVHKLLPGAGLTMSECLYVLESRLDNTFRKKRSELLSSGVKETYR